MILNFARDREGNSSGEAEMEHQERNDTVEEPDDVLYVPHARTSTYRGAMKFEFARDSKGISGEQQHSGNTGMEVILSPAQVVPLQTTPRWVFVPSREVAGAHVQICVW